MKEENLIEKARETANRIAESCPLFMTSIFRKSYPVEYPEAPHLEEWAKELQGNRFTVKLSARKHLKSTSLYGYIMWRLWRMFRHPEEGSIEFLYLSFTKTMAAYHLKNAKRNIERNQFFRGIKDLAPNSDSIIRFTWDGENIMEIEPEGILSFKRGRHPDGVLMDDILADPASELDPGVIEKISRVVREDVMSLPKEGTGELHLVGTAQHRKDIFFELKDNKEVHWTMCKAISNEKERKVLWEQQFSFDRLMQIRDTIKDKAFQKEYMCAPVWSEEAFIKMGTLLKVATAERINPGSFREQMRIRYGTMPMVLAGLDIGKHTHPSHLAIFMVIKKRMVQVYERFFDHCDYTTLKDECNGLIGLFAIDKLYYDDTRGELESFYEQGIINSSIWIPIKFKTTTKHKMAAEFEKRVMQQLAGKDDGIELINSQRMLDQVSMVNNALDAIETPEGHGDSFWSIAMACMAAAQAMDLSNDELEELSKAMNDISLGRIK